VAAAGTGLDASKAAREDRKMALALELNNFGEMDDSGRGQGVADILEAAAHWLKERGRRETMRRIKGRRKFGNRDMGRRDACNEEALL
jgi:hypothetical protein